MFPGSWPGGGGPGPIAALLSHKLSGYLHSQLTNPVVVMSPLGHQGKSQRNTELGSEGNTALLGLPEGDHHRVPTRTNPAGDGCAAGGRRMPSFSEFDPGSLTHHHSHQHYHLQPPQPTTATITTTTNHHNQP
ncbi:unnamed protein product [Boreogadus saida]